jgi:hypothetical protein
MLANSKVRLLILLKETLILKLILFFNLFFDDFLSFNFRFDPLFFQSFLSLNVRSQKIFFYKIFYC